MTEKIKSAIESLDDCIKNQPCECEEFKLAIRSLGAWEEVLQELEEQLHVGKDSNWKNATINAIGIINQKLSMIEEEMITSAEITSLKKENEKLKNRCFALTQGSLCFFCPIKCECRRAQFRNDEKAEVEE